MMNGKFRVIGFENRTVGEKSFSDVTLRASDGTVHKVNTTIKNAKDYLDKEVMCTFSFTWGKYTAGVALIAVA